MKGYSEGRETLAAGLISGRAEACTDRSCAPVCTSVSTRTYLILAALTGVLILVAFTVQVLATH